MGGHQGLVQEKQDWPGRVVFPQWNTARGRVGSRGVRSSHERLERLVLTIFDSFVLFSIGNLEPLFSAVWPTCWKSHTVCNHVLVQSVTYLEICGIIVGQILVGLIGDG